MHVILLISAKIGLIQGHLDLELTIAPAPPPPPRWNFRDYDFLIPYGM